MRIFFIVIAGTIPIDTGLSTASDTALRYPAVKQLLYLAEVLEIQVQFNDFPKVMWNIKVGLLSLMIGKLL